MPKNKTHSGAKKRFRLTGSGKVMRGQAGKRHLLEHKSSRYTRRVTGEAVLAPADVKKITRLLGNHSSPPSSDSPQTTDMQGPAGRSMPAAPPRGDETTWHA